MSEKIYYQLTISISKALSGIETPLKVKHARAAIIGTFHTQGAHTFWTVALRQPLQENRITAWKFCHLLHKLLREGHPLCCQHSMRHRAMLMEMGKLWGHLNDGYGQSIRQYTKLLVTKLEFHDRNPRFPGNLALKRGELESIGGDDANIFFQLAVEMFDYLDEIIALQATIFNSITTFQVNSMTSMGQCRLAPLIPLIQDSNPLYDFLVRIMFKLHTTLPNDVLSGHRDRFRAIFTQLKSFYSQSRNLQYFKTLITVPRLPEIAPNFRSQVDFGAYTPPVVVIPEHEPEPEPEPIVDNLVDTSETLGMPMFVDHQQGPPVYEESVQKQSLSNSSSTEFERIIRDRDDLIMHLQQEVDRLGKTYRSASNEYREETSKMEEKITQLNTQLTEAQEEITTLHFAKDELEMKAHTVEKSQEDEERLKQSEEKFNKIKLLYTQLRDEHVNLLRQHGETNKQLATTKKLVADETNARQEVEHRLEEMERSHVQIEEDLKQTSAIKEQTLELETEKSALQSRIEELEVKNEQELSELKSNLEQKENLIEQINQQVVECETVNQQLQEQIDKLTEDHQQLEQLIGEKTEEINQLITDKQQQSEQEETIKQNVQLVESEKQQLTDQIVDLRTEIETMATTCDRLQGEINEIKREKDELQQNVDERDVENCELKEKLDEKIREIEEIQETVNQKDEQHELDLTERTNAIVEKDGEIEQLQEQIREMVDKCELLTTNVDRLTSDKERHEIELQDLLQDHEHLTERFDAGRQQIAELTETITADKCSADARILSIIETCIRSSEKIASRGDHDVDTEIGTAPYFAMIAEELQAALNGLQIVHGNYLNDSVTNVESLIRKIVIIGHLMAVSHVQGMTICNTSSNIEYGEKISDELRAWSQTITTFFTNLRRADQSDQVQSAIGEVKVGLERITEMIYTLSKKNESDNVADTIEAELSSMDKAIEEAANRIEEMLSKSRASDSGIKLEVNEKILDACTALMNCIRSLVKKSRLLQAEIVSSGKGSASAKEFYKRNHQWTEGLISAAKSVAQGANFLVTAANKAVSGQQSSQLDLVVAAQEIAACSAQLVVASRVKAGRNSSNLFALGQASKAVSQATGAVVATAKDSIQLLEDQQDLDLSNLSVHQAKTLEMEIQVKVLELEQALELERRRLSTFRRKNYQS